MLGHVPKPSIVTVATCFGLVFRWRESLHVLLTDCYGGSYLSGTVWLELLIRDLLAKWEGRFQDHAFRWQCLQGLLNLKSINDRYQHHFTNGANDFLRLFFRLDHAFDE